MTQPIPLRSACVAAALLLTACGSGSEDNAVRRGDVAFASDSLELALAEYRLAARQGGDDGMVLARVAHTHVRMGRVDEAADFYRRAVEADPSLEDLAVADLVRVARAAAERGDRFQMASAMDAALELQPGLGVRELSLPLARHLFDIGEFARAIPFYQRALAARADSTPEVILEVGKAHEEIGDCERALVFFERFRERVRPGERGEVDWFIGNCSFALARELRSARRGRGRAPMELERALAHVNRMLEVGEPRNVLGQAWFEKGEILAALGDCQGAMDAFAQVRWADLSGSSALVERAQERFDQIKFGRGLSQYRQSGGCG